MFMLELTLEHPNSLKVAIFAPKSILLSSNINKLRRQAIAITILNQQLSVVRPRIHGGFLFSICLF